MQKWEYLNLQANTDDKKAHRVWVNQKLVLSDVNLVDFYDYLNSLGKDGWEMVSYNRSSSHPMGKEFYFKRSLSSY